MALLAPAIILCYCQSVTGGEGQNNQFDWIVYSEPGK